jgi:hypothetical protein
MAMKIASSLWCGAVIVLSLAAARAGAQIDSNATIFLYCGPLGGGCSYTVTETDQSGNTLSSWEDGGSLSITIDDTFRSSQNTTGGPPSFTIDSMNRFIRNLEYAKFQDHYYQGSPQQSDGGELVQVHFDSIPYLREANGIIHLDGKYTAYVSFGSFREFGLHQWSYSGGCNENDTVMDSVRLQIIPASIASVLVVANKGTQLSIRIIGLNLLASFEPSAVVQRLEVTNLLGTIVFDLQIESDELNFEIPGTSLPPGCYFARLGDQVAKFVVPPR